MAETIFRTKGLTKAYRSRAQEMRALREFIVILGPSRSGKSTFPTIWASVRQVHPRKCPGLQSAGFSGWCACPAKPDYCAHSVELDASAHECRQWSQVLPNLAAHAINVR
ncbi:MAG: hypothetical protein ACNA7N_15505 [Yoonia sp.]